MKRRMALVVLAGMVGLAGPAAADETTFCNAFITTLPYTITTQGHYCFNRNLSTAINTGAAITINVDFVVLDLNNFKLGGGAAGLGTDAHGIRATNRSNLTIRNGNIRGFRRGVTIIGGANHVVENNVLDGNTQYGVYMEDPDGGGDSPGGVVVRNNLISNTGGSTIEDQAYGIYDWSWQGASQSNIARDNVVTNVFSTSGSGTVVGINMRMTDHNVINLGDAATQWGTTGSYNRDNTVVYADVAFYGAYALIGHNYP